jgi:hypothetical protein
MLSFNVFLLFFIFSNRFVSCQQQQIKFHGISLMKVFRNVDGHEWIAETSIATLPNNSMISNVNYPDGFNAIVNVDFPELLKLSIRVDFRPQADTDEPSYGTQQIEHNPPYTWFGDNGSITSNSPNTERIRLSGVGSRRDAKLGDYHCTLKFCTEYLDGTCKDEEVLHSVDILSIFVNLTRHFLGV